MTVVRIPQQDSASELSTNSHEPLQHKWRRSSDTGAAALGDTYAPAILSVPSSLFQLSKLGAGKATKFGRSGVKLLGVVGAARLECGEPAAESGELIRRQLGSSFGDFLDFHGAHLSTTWRVIQNIRVARERPARGVSKRPPLMSAVEVGTAITRTCADFCF